MRAIGSSFAWAIILMGCGGGMSGAGGGGSSDTANQGALDGALQTMILAHARDVCMARSTCGAVEAQTPPITATEDDVPRLRVAAHDDATFAARCRAADAIAAVTGERIAPAYVTEPDDLFAIGTPPPTGECAAVAQAFCTPVAVELDGACLVGLSYGGGTVATFAKEALETAPHGTAVDGAPSDPLQLVFVAGEPWLVSGHAVHRIHRDSLSGRLRAEELATLNGVPTWYRVDGATLVVQTADRVNYRVTKRGLR